MFDFPTNPASGTVVMVPDGSYRVWDSTKWRASPSSSTITTGPFLPIAGGVMSGALSLVGNATSALHAVPLQQLNTAVAGGPFLPLTPSPITATGSTTSRSLQDRAAEVLNVKDFGAIGDGTADDTAAFLAAVAAVPTSGGTIYAPSGTFMVGAAVLLKANTHLRGNGPQATTIKMRNGTNVAGLIGNAVNGSSFISVSDLTVDGNKANNGAGTSQGINMAQVSQVTLRNVEVANVNGYGVTISGNGVNTTRGAYVSRVYIHHCDLTGFSVTFACRQTVIDGLICAFNGSAGNPTFAAIFLDASECVTSNVLADSNISNGIHIHNVFGCSYDGLTATRNGRHGIYVEVLTTSTGANWRAQSNGTQTSNTYDDIHFVNTNLVSPGYGITANCSVNGITVGPDANYGSALTRYGLYVEDNITTNVHLADVSYVGMFMTGNVRVPASLGTLTVDDVPFLKLTGGVLTGPLTVANGNELIAQNSAVQFGAIANSSFTMLLVGTSGSFRSMKWYSGDIGAGGVRWEWGVDNGAESGSNAGANFFLEAYGDAGASAPIGYPIRIVRSTMQTTFAGPVLMSSTLGVTGATTFSAAVTLPAGSTGPFLSTGGGTVAGSVTISSGTFTASNGVQITGQNPAHQFGAIANASLDILLVGASGGYRFLKWFSNSNGGTGLRWSMGANNTAEGGSNAGSDFALGCYTDTGVSIGTPILITRSSMLTTFAGPVRMNGTVGFNNTAPIAKPTVSGAKGSNAALGSLITALAAYGLITDSSTA